MGFVFGSQVSLYYRPELWNEGWADTGIDSVYGSGTCARGTSSATAWRYPSDGVENFTLTVNNNAELIHTMSKASATDVAEGMRSYNMSFDYYLQRHNTTDDNNLWRGRFSSLEYYAQNRNSEGSMMTLTVAVCPTSSTTLLCTGGVIESWGLSAAAGERIKCSVSMKFSGVTTSNEEWSGSQPQDLNTGWETMNDATLTRTSWFDNGVANLSFTIANGAEELHKIGSVQPAACYEGKQNITGSCDVFLNSTGTYEWEQVYGATKGVLVFTSGDTSTAGDTSMIWIFRDVIFTEVPITSSTDTTALQSGLSWIAGSVEFLPYAV